MKKTIGLFLIFSVLALNAVTGQESDRQLYKDKLHTYQRMHNVGLTLSGIGGGSFLAGSLLLGTLPKSYWESTPGYADPNQHKYDQQAVQSMIFLSLGVGLLAGGLTMSHLGKRKATIYRQQLDHISLGVVSVPGGQGLSLTYHF
jgi:hypothetical protein